MLSGATTSTSWKPQYLMMLSVLRPFVVSLLLASSSLSLNLYTGSPPALKHAPFGFGSKSTGGSTNASVAYLVTNAKELREAIALPWTKTIYVKGIIDGAELDNGTLATCQSYIDTTGTAGAAIRQFSFERYLLSLNSTYTALVADAAAKNQLFEGKNATEYLALLKKMNGWRPVVSATQKSRVAFTLTNNTSLIGLDGNAALNGINLKLSSVDNIWVRNLKLVSPADCFPAPETYPSSWNANYDAVSLVTSTNIWFDGCELQDQLNGEYVQPDILPPGWEVDRFDGLFDCEDGSDNVTFSHNIIRNHHKSLLLGGGSKEAPRDLGKMHFTIYGNLFNGSASRNPLMRFGTFDIAANIFQQHNDATPVFKSSGLDDTRVVDRAETPSDAVFEYNLGVYNQSTAIVRSNVFLQSGKYSDDPSRIFTLSEDTDASIPARICILDEGAAVSTLNGRPVNVSQVATETVRYHVDKKTGKAVEGGVLVTCQNVNVGYKLPKTFGSSDEVKQYVLNEAGMY